MGRRGKLVLQAAAVAVVALLIALLGWQVVTKDRSRGIPAAVAAGKLPSAPDFELPRLDGNGSIRLSSLRGKAVVLNFWASWCAPCKREAPELQSASERYGRRGLVVLGVDSQDFRGDASRFMERYRLRYPSVHDAGDSTSQSYGVTGFPETFFIDARGRIVAHVSGPVEPDEIDTLVSRMLES